MSQHEYTINFKSTIIDALKKIDENRKGFLIVVNEDRQVLGTLTDGDVRRALINGYTIDNQISDIFSKDFQYIKVNDTFDNLIEAFKNDRVNFLPILNSSMQLSNVITKKQLQYALIQDIDFDFGYDFSAFDQMTIEYEIYNRPWGFYKTAFLNGYAQAKIIKVYPQGELSLQEHKMREEHWVVIAGEGRMVIGESIKNVRAGDYIFIPKGCKHKITNTTDDCSLMISEVQLGDYFGEDDIIRYEDKYGRC
jgi:mannose-1-phosphate guanylyltransferase / mannose-6-phosphate isomerase